MHIGLTVVASQAPFCPKVQLPVSKLGDVSSSLSALLADALLGCAWSAGPRRESSAPGAVPVSWAGLGLLHPEWMCSCPTHTARCNVTRHSEFHLLEQGKDESNLTSAFDSLNRHFTPQELHQTHVGFLLTTEVHTQSPWPHKPVFYIIVELPLLQKSNDLSRWES